MIKRPIDVYEVLTKWKIAPPLVGLVETRERIHPTNMAIFIYTQSVLQSTLNDLYTPIFSSRFLRRNVITFAEEEDYCIYICICTWQW